MTYPQQVALTRRFSLGRPRAFTMDVDRERVLFLRSKGPQDPITRLWALDLSTGTERLVADPERISVGLADLPPEERARRERARETSEGIVAYGTDDAVSIAAFALGGAMYRVDLATGEITDEPLQGGVYDVRPDPTGQRIAGVVDGALHVVAPGVAAAVVAQDDADDVSWGVADFVAAEEMGRQRGYWWSPDGTRLIAARVDNGPVDTWFLGDPAHPDRSAPPHRYPAAGTPNASVSLAVIDVRSGSRTWVDWDRDGFPYVVDVRWDALGPALLVVQNRAQDEIQVRTIDAATGATALVRSLTGTPWVEVAVGAPRWLPGGSLLTVEDRLDHGDGGTRCLAIDGQVVTPAGMQVRAVEGLDGGTIWFTASHGDPTEIHVHRYDPTDDAGPARVTSGAGVHAVAVGDGMRVEASVTADSDLPHYRVVQDGAVVATIPSHSAHALVSPVVEHLELGERRLRGALLLPTDHDGTTPLPVILDPYGGPHAQRVVRSRLAFATSQWLADQGFAVLVVDGRGTPGRDLAFEHAVRGDLATPALQDQIDALRAAGEMEPLLDLSRVGIRGWSFGGYLAALAVLRRPDVFTCGVAGAPVTDWRLYDTHYTERYLGLPQQDPEAYRRSSLVDDAGLVDPAEVPAGRDTDLLIIHGLADDNVVAAHSLKLSGALLAAGRRHRFLPLSGVTHMTPQATITENLLLLEVDFFRERLCG